MRLGFVRFLDVILLGLDGVVYLMVVVLFAVMARKLVRLRRDFFRSSLNVLDMGNYTCFIITLYFKVLLWSLSSEHLSTPPDAAGRQAVVDFDRIGSVMKTVSDWNGFNSLLTWVKALVYISLFHRSPNMLIQNITRAAVNLGVLLVLFVLILWAFAQALFVSFGLDIEELRRQDEALGFLLAVAFLFICIFSMINMFFSVIMLTYDEITSELIEDPVDVYFREGIRLQISHLAAAAARWVQCLRGMPLLDVAHYSFLRRCA